MNIELSKRKELEKAGMNGWDDVYTMQVHRYWAGFAHWHPALDDVEYMWRIPVPTRFMSALEDNVFADMMRGGQTFAIVSSFHDEAKRDHTSLVHALRLYQQEHPSELDELPVWFLDDEQRPCLVSPAGMDIVQVSALRSPRYDALFRWLDAMGGFFYDGWDVNMLRAAYMLMSQAKVMLLGEKMAVHAQGQWWCPSNEVRRQGTACSTQNWMEHRRSSASCTRFFASNSPHSPI